MSFNLIANIDFNKTCVPFKKCDHTGVTFKQYIEIPCTWTMPPMLYPNFSMSTLQIWTLMSGVLSMVWRRISEAQRWQIIGMRSSGMSFKAMDVRCAIIQPACVKTQPNQHHERLVKIRKTTCNVAAWRKDNVCQIDVYQQEQLGTVCNQQDWSQRQ